MSRSFIVIEPDPIILLDLEGTLLQRFPNCRLITGGSIQEIGAAIHQCGPDTTMFVKDVLFRNEDIKHVVRTAAIRGCQIVTIGEIEGLDVPSTSINIPFTTDMVIAAVDDGASLSPP